jgi:hypothetical protein
MSFNRCSASPGSRTHRRGRAPTWPRPTEEVSGEIITHDECLRNWIESSNVRATFQ